MAVLIDHCIASKPGIFKNREIDLRNPVSIIYGGNDSGKSLLARAMLDTVWGLGGGDSLLNEKVWSDLYLNVLLVNTTARYRFIKNGNKQFSILHQIEGREREILAREQTDDGTTGTIATDEGAFRSLVRYDLQTVLGCSFLPSQADLQATPGFRYEYFRNVLMDDGSNFYGLFLSVKNAMQATWTAGRPGAPLVDRLLNTEGMIKETEKKIQLIDIQDSKFAKLQKEKREIENRIRICVSESAGVDEHLEQLAVLKEKYAEWERLKNEIQTLRDELSAEREKKKRLARLEHEVFDQFPQFRDFNEEKRNNLKKIQELYRDIRNNNERLDVFISARQHQRKTICLVAIPVVTAIAAAIIVLFFDLLMVVPEKNKAMLLYGLLFLFTMGACISALLLLLTFDKKKRISLLRERSELEDQLKKIFHANNVSLHEYTLEALYDFLLQYFDEFSEYTEHQLEFLTLRDQLQDQDRLKGLEREISGLENQEQQVRRIIDSCGDAMPGIMDDDFDSARFIAVQGQLYHERERLHEELAVQQGVLHHIGQEMQRHRDRKLERQRLLRDKKKHDADLHYLNTHRTTVQYVFDCLQESMDVREEKQLERLVESVKQTFDRLTDYQYVAVIDHALIKRFIRDDRITDDFSPAIIHLLHLCIKIAATGFFIDSNSAPPLIIDEPFLFMDDRRTGRLKEIIDSISSQRQVIIFTHSNSFKDWGGYAEL